MKDLHFQFVRDQDLQDDDQIPTTIKINNNKTNLESSC
jgi:hypothetical protein